MANCTASTWLCTTCSAIFEKGSADLIRDYGDFSTSVHHPTYDSWCAAAAAGCWICVKLSPMFSNSTAESFKPAEYTLRYSEDSRSYKLKFASLSIDIEPYTYDPPSTTLVSLAKASQQQSWTGDDCVADLAKEWLKNCQQNHVQCSAGTPNRSSPPKRLLHISDELIHLVESGRGNRYVPYATLSHCWGNKRFYVLSPATRKELKTGLRRTLFPLTFQHAFSTAQRLGLEYLWIDCYCIMQGESSEAKADWLIEGAKMDSIYANAVVNIGSTHASDPHQGIFSTRIPKRSPQLLIRWCPFADDSSADTLYKLSETLGGGGKTMEALRQLVQSPLLRRAWVTQECVLSQRMISFTADQVVWQCSENGACEDECKPETDQRSNSDPFWTLTEIPSLLNTRRRGPDILQYRWFTTLEFYCSTSLTYPEKDFLKAIEGVGKQVSNLTGDSYHRGFLRNTLPEALLWMTRRNKPDEGGKFRRSLPCRAPTWHWASYEGPMDFSLAGNFFHLRGQRAMWAFRPARLAYPAISVDWNVHCKEPKGTDSWRILPCVGRLLRLTLCPRADDNVEDDGHIHCNLEFLEEILSAELDEGARIIRLEDRLAFLPLVYTWRYDGLILRLTENGTWQRIGILGFGPRYDKEPAGWDRRGMGLWKKKKPTLFLLE